MKPEMDRGAGLHRGLSNYKDINLDNLPDWQLGWLAGILDGEGCISINKLGKPTVTITSTMPIGDVLTWMVGFGGQTVGAQRSEKHKLIHRWYISSVAGIYTLLSKLSPFLLMKRKQCDLMLEYCEGRLGHLSKTKEWYFSEMRFLNKRGVSNDEAD